MTYIPDGLSFEWKRKANGSFEFLSGGKTYSGAKVYFNSNSGRWHNTAFPPQSYGWDTKEEALKAYEKFYAKAVGLQERDDGCRRSTGTGSRSLI